MATKANGMIEECTVQKFKVKGTLRYKIEVNCSVDLPAQVSAELARRFILNDRVQIAGNVELLGLRGEVIDVDGVEDLVIEPEE